ncbi:AI-2E family transporter [Campylobacter geochelonis]|uniref:Transport protein n=1 Tax=Campylobacter geochelonis TaxID=1780362 RepID=A0A128EC54_9BACT|nr:AI-2E family transporter [Campylobacter geochelonis]QKF70536.1 putative autoinducer 2 (AI-2E family) transporter [Campylobacter geochelonis]CZE46086.1 transport protein [Campylobacter geochelonis]CZE46550.1 transport protein [Campylobacter geochelonis]CZE50422.1 transport protein [Campylobacter geochelonis]
MRIHFVFISLASIIIILAGLKAASGVIVPFLLAVFLAVIVSPLIDILEKIKIPRIISFVLVTICFLGILSILGYITINAMADFTAQLPEFQRNFKLLLDGWIEKINSYDVVKIDAGMLGFDPSSIFSTTSSFLRKTSSTVSMSFFILLMVAFMLFETSIMKEKVAYLQKQNPQAQVFAQTFVYNLKRYLMIKSIASAMTGLIIGIGLWYLNVPYATLWGVVAFILNYIPTIGSIVAAVPTLFVTLLTGDFSDSFWVLAIYVAVNTAIGTIIEPRFLGEGLGLSTIVILFSLLLWGYVLGIGGLFLAVPLTMSIQIALNSSPKTKFIAILLSNKVD